MKFRDRWFDLDLPLAFSSTESKRNCAEVESACLSLKADGDAILRRRSLPRWSSYLSNWILYFFKKFEHHERDAAKSGLPVNSLIVANA